MNNDLFKKLAPDLRAIGFRGSGQNFRKHDGDFVFVINFQKSSSGDKFYVNLGAQPVFIPAEGNADLTKLKEYECVLRTRVGKHWSQHLSEKQVAHLRKQLLEDQARFFEHAKTMRAAIAVDPPEVLIKNFSKGTTQARATLHLARAAFALGATEKARELVHRGLELASDAATGLRSELRALLAAHTFSA